MANRIPAFLPSIFLSSLILFSGCGPKYTFPATKVPHEIEKIARDEYQISLVARVVGKTVGAVLYVDRLLDDKGQIDKEVHDKMGKAMLVVTRVSLSTDLPVDYCVVVIRDAQTGNEVSVTRSLDDTKRANADALGIEESMNRTLFQQGRYQPGPRASRRSFVLKEMTQPRFLAEQIAQRIRFGFARETAKDEPEKQPLMLVDGHFRENQDGKRVFRISVIAIKGEHSANDILDMFKIANKVLAGYRFEGFDVLEINDYLNRQKLTADRETLLDYQNKKISDQALLERCLTESQSAQEAFKLFGFTMPDGDEPPAAIPTATAAS